LKKTTIAILLIIFFVTPLHAELFVGTGAFSGSVANPAFLVDESTGVTTEIFSGVPVWGAVYDINSNRVLFTTSGLNNIDGATLMQWIPGDASPTQVGVITFGGQEIRIDGLAIIGSQLYGAHQFDSADGNAGIYVIDMSSLVATFATAFTSGAVSGIEADPTSGLLYGVNDTTESLDLIDISGGTLTPVANYPAGEDDIDGLAVYNGIAYMVPDDDTPGEIFVYNLNTSSYQSSLPAPWTATDTFSGAAFIYKATPSSVAIPTLSEWGMILMSLVLSTSAFWMMRRRQMS
jgi:hypothetical protein